MKIVFAHTKAEFLRYCELSHIIGAGRLKQIKERVERPNSYNQLQPEEYFIRPLVEVFFGKNAGADGRYGEMFDWMHRNLRNADGTISLRPFLDFIRYAIQKQNERPELNSVDCPLLSHECFNVDVRVKAVERHFRDLADEEGNERLRTIMDDIKNDRVSRELKQSSLSQDEFEKLLKEIVGRHDELKDVSLIELEEDLKLNGIVFVRHVPGGRKRYSFAYLYKYYLGLRTPRRGWGRW